MKKRTWTLGLVMAMVAVFGFTMVGTAQEDEFEIKSELWKEHTKPAVPFTHLKHADDYGIACNECHHVFEGGKNVWEEGDDVQKCEECHNEPTIKGEKKLPEAQQKLNLKLAFHNNCTGCHKAHKKENKDTTAPITCTQCHPKAE